MQGPEGPAGPQGEQGPMGPQGPAGQDGQDADLTQVAQMIEDGDAATLDAANQYAAAGDATTLASANAHAAAGDAATLTASKSYTDGKATQTLTSANAYTDSKFAAWNDSFTQYQQQVDLRFTQTDKRIDQMGAMSGAMTSAAINTAGLPGRNRVGMGVGVQNGRSAVAVSYQRLVRPNASVSLTGAFSSGESSISAGAGFSW